MRIEAGGYFSQAADQFSNRIAVASPGRTVTYEELRRAANRIGSALSRAGIAPGDRVAVLSHNRVEVAELWLGLERWGMVRVVLHSHFDMATHVRTLADVGAAALVFDTRFTAAIEARRGEMPSVRYFVAIGPNPPSWAASYATFRDAGQPDDPLLDVAETAPFCIQLTTGTTGFPKPWIVTHRAWHTLIANNLEHLDTMVPGVPAIGPDDVNVHFHALQWASGAQTMMPYMLRGGKNLVLDDAAFDPRVIIDTIAKERVTGFFVPGPMLPPLLSAIEERGGIAHRLRRVVIFFATPELLQIATKVLGPVWCHGFGSTEQGAPATRLTCHEAQEKPQRLASVGRPVTPFFEIAVVDEHGRRVKPGAVGEIVVRSPVSASAYWELPEKTGTSFFPGGWFRPNDIGYLDEDGFLFYLDRAKDRIPTAVGVVYPHVVESAVLRHGAVAHCGVVALDGEIVAAVLLKSGASGSAATEREIITAAAQGLAPHEVPKRVFFVEELPTVLGGAKVQREVLQKRLAALARGR